MALAFFVKARFFAAATALSLLAIRHDLFDQRAAIRTLEQTVTNGSRAGTMLHSEVFDQLHRLDTSFSTSSCWFSYLAAFRIISYLSTISTATTSYGYIRRAAVGANRAIDRYAMG